MDHGQSGSPEPQDARPTHAERARTLVAAGGISTLSTQSRKHPGYPFGSVMPYAAMPDGSPVFLISRMAVHTKNLQGSGRATLLILAGGQDDMLGAGRLSLMGDVAIVKPDQAAPAREVYLEAHPNAAQWIDFDDFHLYQMRIVDIYYVGGFGMMGWVSPAEYADAEPDPLASAADAVIEHMNSDHADAVVRLVREAADVECQQAVMTALDRYGFLARVVTESGYRGVRVDFPTAVGSANEVRKVLIEMLG